MVSIVYSSQTTRKHSHNTWTKKRGPVTSLWACLTPPRRAFEVSESAPERIRDCSPPSRLRQEWRGMFVLGGISMTHVAVCIEETELVMGRAVYGVSCARTGYR